MEFVERVCRKMCEMQNIDPDMEVSITVESKIVGAQKTRTVPAWTHFRESVTGYMAITAAIRGAQADVAADALLAP